MQFLNFNQHNKGLQYKKNPLYQYIADLKYNSKSIMRLYLHILHFSL